MVEQNSTEVTRQHFDRAGRYLIKGVLGRGNFGIVYRVLDTQWHQEVALKTTRDGTPEQKQWLKEEYRVQSDIVHPILVPPDELRVEGDRYFFTMKLVERAVPFNQYFDFDRQSPLPQQANAIGKICVAALELADGLRAIHYFDRCHGDIKPDNVLVTENGQIALLDFGLMRSTSTEQGDHNPSLIGTPAYLPPEQYEGIAADVNSDWYAFGLMLFETLAGQPAFTGDPLEVLIAKQISAPSITQHLQAIPPPLAELIDSMLDPIIDNRPGPEKIFSVLQAYANNNEPIDDTDSGVWQSPEIAASSSFVARENELAVLQRAFKKSGEGFFSFVEVVGPSGIGKTCLIQHFLEKIQTNSEPLIFHGRCLPHESIPYKAFDAIVDSITNYWINLSAEEAQQLLPKKNADAIAVLFPELRRIEPLNELTLNAVSTRGDPHALRQAGFDALGEVLTTLASKFPVVLWVDDIQWADRDSAALLEGIFARGDAPPILLLVTRRPDVEVAEARLTDAIDRILEGSREQLVLTPLTIDSCDTLARSIIGFEEQHHEIIRHIVDQAGGLPYLVSELAHYIKSHDGKVQFDRAPGSTHSLLSERLNRLNEEDAVLVELAAVAASPLSPAVIMAAAESGQRFRLRDLTILRLLRWLDDGEQKLIEIYHDHLREHVVAALPAEKLLKRHTSLLNAMEAAGGYQSASLLTHAIAINDRTRTRYHALQAAQRASESLAFAQAVAFYETALATFSDSKVDVDVQISYAETLADAGRGIDSARAYETALTLSQREESEEFKNALRRRAGEQYLKSGRFNDGLRIMAAFLKRQGVRLPTSGLGALLVIAWRRARLYLGGFRPREFNQQIEQRKLTRLDDLWAATTALAMMDPVRADSLGLVHFSESLAAGDKAHIARSYGFEAAFAALIGGPKMQAKANELIALNSTLLDSETKPYEQAFYHLGLGSAAFLNSDWSTAYTNCEFAAKKFRSECRGAEFEAAVATTWVFQALGQAGEVKELVERLPEAIRDADVRSDLFAANNYRGGFHALARIAAGQLDVVQEDLGKVVETWTPGLYQMHAYHRIFAGVNADLYLGNPHAALARIEDDWTDLRRGLFLAMKLPALELRWTRAKALVAVAAVSVPRKRRKLINRVRRIIRQIERAGTPAAQPHAQVLRAGVAALYSDKFQAVSSLRQALSGYANANMQIHRETVRWTLAQLLIGEEANLLSQTCQRWQEQAGVAEMRPLVAVIAPGVDRLIAKNAGVPGG